MSLIIFNFKRGSQVKAFEQVSRTINFNINLSKTQNSRVNYRRLLSR